MFDKTAWTLELKLLLLTLINLLKLISVHQNYIFRVFVLIYTSNSTLLAFSIHESMNITSATDSFASFPTSRAFLCFCEPLSQVSSHMKGDPVPVYTAEVCLSLSRQGKT